MNREGLKLRSLGCSHLLQPRVKLHRIPDVGSRPSGLPSVLGHPDIPYDQYMFFHTHGHLGPRSRQLPALIVSHPALPGSLQHGKVEKHGCTYSIHSFVHVVWPGWPWLLCLSLSHTPLSFSQTDTRWGRSQCSPAFTACPTNKLEVSRWLRHRNCPCRNYSGCCLTFPFKIFRARTHPSPR